MSWPPEDPHGGTKVLVLDGHHVEAARWRALDHLAKPPCHEGSRSHQLHRNRSASSSRQLRQFIHSHTRTRCHNITHRRRDHPCRCAHCLHPSGICTWMEIAHPCHLIRPLFATRNAQTGAPVIGPGCSASPTRSPRSPNCVCSRGVKDIVDISDVLGDSGGNRSKYTSCSRPCNPSCPDTTRSVPN